MKEIRVKFYDVKGREITVTVTALEPNGKPPIELRFSEKHFVASWNDINDMVVNIDKILAGSQRGADEAKH